MSILSLNDFKRKFDFLQNKYNMKIIGENSYKKYFNDIIIDYQKGDFKIRITREKLQIYIFVFLRNKWCNYTFLRAIIREIDLKKFDNDTDIEWYSQEMDIDKIIKELDENMPNIIKLAEAQDDTFKKLEIILQTYTKNRGW